MNRKVLIVGAGVAGLSCARELMRHDQELVVLERSKGVGGRCATRRVDDQAVDHGVVFLHGSETDFITALEEVTDATPLWGWPARVEGHGTPCQPHAFGELERRVAFVEGVSAFPKHLARGLPVKLGVEVTRIETDEAGWRVFDASGRQSRADDLVLALPAPQTFSFLEGLPALNDELRAARALLGMLGSHPTLAVLAGYPLDTPSPRFDVCYPAETRAVHLIAHDSAKRQAPARRVLVVQARPCWTSLHLEEPRESWASALLYETAGIVGDWARDPLWVQPHRWRLGRADRGMELRGPMLVELSGGLRLGLCGEVFSPGAGVEAAYLSGRRLAHRLCGD